MIKCKNSIYKAEHNKQPRGLGMWGFYVPIKDETLTKLNCPLEHYQVEGFYHGKFCMVWASKVMTLTEAKKEVIKWLTSNDLTKGTIYVAD